MRKLVILLAFGTLAWSACDSSQAVAPAGPQGSPSHVTYQPRPGIDTSTTAGFPSPVSIVGTVYRAGTGVPTDTGVVSTAAPLGGVTVRLMRNVLQNGQGVSIEMARAISDPGGEFSVAGLPGGYYVVQGLDASGEVATYELVATTQPVTRTSIWIP
ncbi:MAG TPA: hypothetical protein VNH46_00435 [Gemmatimonadales bacterium]|nr:hypothetical protein [Gemmatimonadales bacterium]